MDRQSGRNDNKTLREVGAREHDDDEELDLWVDGAVKEGLKYSETGGAAAWSKATATDDAYKGKVSEVDDQEELILNPKKTDWDWSERESAGVKGRKDILGRGEDRPGAGDDELYKSLRGGGDEIMLDRPEELELNPKNMNHDQNNVHARWSKKKDKDPSRLNRPSLLKPELGSPEELMLSPVKPEAGPTATSVSWNKSADNGRGGRGGLRELDDEAEELILAPKGPREGQVAQSASWQKQSTDVGRGGRHDAVDDEIAEREELKLSPKEVRRPQQGSADWSRRSDDPPRRGAEPLTDDQEELKLSPKEIRRDPKSSKAAFKASGGAEKGLEETSLEEELKLSPREVAKKRTAVPDKAPVISDKAKQKALRESQQAAETARQEKADRIQRDKEHKELQQQPDESLTRTKESVEGANDHHRPHKEATVTWKDEVPGGDHRLVEGSPHVRNRSDSIGSGSSSGRGTDTSSSRKQGGSKSKPKSKPRVVGAGGGGKSRDPTKRVQSSVSRAFNSVEEPSPPVIKAPTPTTHVPEGFSRGPSTVKHFSSSVSQAYDNVGHAPLPDSKPPRSRNSSGKNGKFVSNVSRAYDDADQQNEASAVARDLATMNIE